MQRVAVTKIWISSTIYRIDTQLSSAENDNVMPMNLSVCMGIKSVYSKAVLGGSIISFYGIALACIFSFIIAQQLDIVSPGTISGHALDQELTTKHRHDLNPARQ